MEKILYPTQIRWAGIIVVAMLPLFLAFCNSQSLPSTNVANESNTLPGPTVFTSQLAPVIGIVVDQNMKIVSVEKGGTADKGGLEPGDILKNVNSRNVSQPQAARQAFYSQNSSQKTRLTILRNGKEKTFEIVPAARVGKAGQSTPTPVPPDMTYF